MKNHGFLRVAAAAPELKVANPQHNAAQIINVMKMAHEASCSLLVTPELSVTGYSCGDLFGQTVLLKQALTALERVVQASIDTEGLITLVGIPLEIDQKVYNCAVAILNGRILGVVPKQYLPNHGEFYEKRWFESGLNSKTGTISLLGQQTSFGNLLFACQDEDLPVTFGIEICEDLWTPIPPSSYLTMAGALIIANLSASNELAGKAEYRYHLVSGQSARCICGYVYASAGVYESTTDVVYGGDCLIAENGTVLVRSKRFARKTQLVFTEVDIETLLSERRRNRSFFGHQSSTNQQFQTVPFEFASIPKIVKLNRAFPVNPFLPDDASEKNRRCQEIFNIQTAGLVRRLEHTGAKYAVLGISGGLDSTLALLVTVKAFDQLALPRKQILAVIMPGFATTSATYTNAVDLARSLHTSVKEIDIRPACLQHFQDIGHNIDVHDVTYENTQARERTQILMDLANQVKGLVVGTGDLSELALGWCTYNGDHMSMYAVNASVPKTLIRHLMQWIANENPDVSEVLYRIIDTPISPELVPGDAPNEIKQKTEDIIGPYELHDFFLYHFLRQGMSPKKILFLANQVFAGKYTSDVIAHWLSVFCRRFFSQQFKRSCLPDGPMVGSVSLSPRGAWRMPSDADVSAWLSELEN